MIAIDIDVRKLDEFRRAIRAAGKSIPREMAAAFNATAKKTKSSISKQIRTELASSAKGVNDTISITKKATTQSLNAGVRLGKTKRVPLKDFGARQVRAGVSYRVSKGGSRKLATSAFMGPKPGVKAPRLNGHVFKRKGPGRLPIVKLMGASPWAVFIKQRMSPEQVKMINAELLKQVDRRIKLNVMRANGLVKN